MTPDRPLGLTWGENPNRETDKVHVEWHAPCGCAFHPTPFPHVHPCANEHKRPDLHTPAATPIPPSDAVRKAAIEIVDLVKREYVRLNLITLERDIESIISRHSTATVVVGEGDEARARIAQVLNEDRCMWCGGKTAHGPDCSHGVFPTDNKAAPAVNYRQPHVFDPVGNDVDECECGLTRDAGIHPTDNEEAK